MPGPNSSPAGGKTAAVRREGLKPFRGKEGPNLSTAPKAMRKRMAKLKARADDYGNKMTSGTNASEYTKPGSMNLRKQ